MPKPGRIFLSHSAKDRSLVERLARLLDDHKLRYFYSRRHILGAQQWHDEIGKALARCDWFVLVLSPDAVASKWVKHELLFALEDRAYEGHIVVLDYHRARYKKLSWTLHSVQWVDFRHGFDGGCRELLRVWNKEYRPVQGKGKQTPGSKKAG